MNIVNKLTLRHLKENKARTVVTTMGICVSVAMITAVFVAMASFLNLFGDIELLGGGNKHAVFNVDSQQQLRQLKDDDRIERIGISVSDDYGSSFQLADRKSDRTGTGDIYQGDKTNLEMKLTGEYEGTIPENENEIAVEKSLIEKNNLNWKIGDTVEIPLGYRYTIDSESGEESILQGSYFGSESFRNGDIGKFKITAILNDNPATLNFDIIRGFDSSNLSFEDGQIAGAYILLKEVNYNSLNELRSMVKEYDIKEYNLNNDYLSTKFAIDKDSTLMTSLLPIVLIILVIIMIASVVLIYNAFGMSLSERLRYLGMLASVGATKKQKRASVYYEGLILGAVGIPVGIGAGILGIGITLKSIGDKIISTGMVAGATSDKLSLNVVVPLWAVIGVVIFSTLTIFISSVIPARKASRVTPIDAIRQNDEIKIKTRKLKTPKIVRAVFGYEGELAHKNLKRNGRKSRVITASIALSVILFLSCNYFCSVFTRSIDIEVDVPYQVQAAVEYDKKDEFIDKVNDLPGVDNSYCVLNDYYTLGKAGEQEEDDLLKDFVNPEFLTNTYKRLFNSPSNLFMNVVDDADFNKLCEANGIDYKEYYGNEIKALLLNNVSHIGGSADVFNDKMLGTNIHFPNDKNLIVENFVKYDADNYVCNLNPKNTISLFVPLSVYHDVWTNGEENSDFIYMMGIETEQHENVCEQLSNLFDENNYSHSYLMDFVDSFQVMNTLTFVLQVFVYGFIALITLITIANIINSISTSIQLRRKEFAMLKSVGTTPKGFAKMVSLESVFYGLKALLVSLPLSILISFGMNKALGSDVVAFEINWLLYLAVIAVVFVIVGITMLYAVSKLKHDSIVETLKEDIS